MGYKQQWVLDCDDVSSLNGRNLDLCFVASRSYENGKDLVANGKSLV